MTHNPRKKPDWLKINMASGASFASTRRLLDRHSLHTVCRSALCPNLQECWSRGTATFLLLGSVCSRQCRFCAVEKKISLPPLDPAEPDHVATAIALMKLTHAVLTSVTRDDLEDGGAAHWVATIRSIRKHAPHTTIEALIPDFKGNHALLDLVMQETPDILNHNIETVPELYPKVRPQASWETSLSVIEQAKRQHGLATKSGIMVGMGETETAVAAAMADLVRHGCDMITIGQYLQPSKAHLPVERYITPEEFKAYETMARQAGFRHVQSGPFVRSSYYAEHFTPEPR